MKPKAEENDKEETHSTDNSSSHMNDTIVELAKNINMKKGEIDSPS